MGPPRPNSSRSSPPTDPPERAPLPELTPEGTVHRSALVRKRAYTCPMHRLRFLPIALLALASPVIAGCSSSSTSSTTTTKAGSATASTSAADLPATGSVNGMTLEVTSSPHKGTVGSTSITIKAVVKGTVTAAKLNFAVSSSASANKGQPATDQQVSITGPGTYTMPKAFSPTKAGNWASTVTYTPTATGNSTLSVSGLPPVPDSKPPFPQLVTVVTAG